MKYMRSLFFVSVLVESRDPVEAFRTLGCSLGFGQKFVALQVDCHAQLASRDGLEHSCDPASATDAHVLGKRDL